MYDYPFTVHSYEADPEGRLTLPALCAYMQEAAWHNAERMGAGVGRLGALGLAWVLHRLRIVLRGEARFGDALTVSTWARRFDELVAYRDFEVRDAAGDLVAAATSRWVVVDLAARRLVRLPRFLGELPVPDRPPAAAGADAVLSRAESLPFERRFAVRRRDLDTARHANHTRYVEWALETVPDDCWEHCRPGSFEVVFRREALYGDTVRSSAGVVAPPPPASEPRMDGARAFAHRLERDGDGEELAQAASVWLPRNPGVGP